MKFEVKIQKSNDFFHHLVVLIFFFIFVFAVGNIMYWQTNRSAFWVTVYSVALYIVFLLDVFFIILHIIAKRKVAVFCLITFGYLLYEILVSLFTNFNGIGLFIQDGLTWPLTFVVFYCYALYVGKDVIIRAVKNILFVGSVICMILLINNIRIHLSSTLDGLQGGVIGPLYLCLSLLGLILLMGNQREKIIFSILIGLMILVSAKRTGFAIIIIGLLLYYWFDARVENRLSKRGRRYGRIVIIAFIIFVIVLWAVNRFDLQIITRFLNTTDDGGSGRLLIWDSVLSKFGQSNIIEQVFGHGFYAVPSIVKPLGRGIYAHNSYLEALFDVGLIGLAWLAGIVISLIVKALKMLKEKYEYAPVLLYSLVEILLLSFFSYFFEVSHVILLVAVLWGICLGDFQRESNRGKNKKTSLNKMEIIDAQNDKTIKVPIVSLKKE